MRLAVIKRRFEELRKQVFTDIAQLPKMRRTICFYEGPAVYASKSEMPDIGVGEIWAEPNQTAFLHFTGDFWQEDNWFDIWLGSEGCLFVDGKPYAGIDENHRLVPIPKGYHEFEIEAFNRYEKPLVLSRAHVISVNRSLDNLTNIALEAVKLADSSDPIIAKEVEEIFSEILISLVHSSNLEVIAKEALELLSNRLKKFQCNKLPGKLVLIPQSHLDLAWLWPEKETVRKVSRTFSTALRLGEMFDEFIYHQSQPQLFDYAKTYYPELYAEIKEAVKNGKFELVGGMWVEPDCNMPSGEAFVRQLLYGKRFFEEEFGISPEVEWLPDVFGFSPSLPQLLIDSGTKAFMTIKTGWNDTNSLPDSVFNWCGIDGTMIPVFIPRALNEDVTAIDALKAIKNSQRSSSLPTVAHLMGYGDGGGGVTVDQMNKGRLIAQLPALPEIEFGSAKTYVEENILQKPIKHKWDGELYLELHRGTTTTQARNKKWNRKLEFKIRDVEILSSFAHVLGSEYPQIQIEEAWKVILKNQMHDILPGSGIGEVYKDSEKDYLEADKVLDTLQNNALSAIASRVKVNTIEKYAKSYIVFNTLSFERTTLVRIKDAPKNVHFVDSTGKLLRSQRLSSGDTLVESTLPQMGYTTIASIFGKKEYEEESPFIVSSTELSNSIIAVSIGDCGRIEKVKDLSTGEVVVSNKEHHLRFYDDRPLVWDAWEIDADYREIAWDPEKLVSCNIKENGPLCVALELTWIMNKSTITQEIILYRGSKRIDFKTHVDWQERHVLLKTAFDTNIRTRYATFDVAFGKYQRPTFQNTTWERAQYEVPAHKWADLSDMSHGISLINDCKYGYDVDDKRLGLSLLRSPTYPDQNADIGSHDFTYALYLHSDNSCGHTIKQAYDLNLDLIVKELKPSGDKITYELPQTHSFIVTKSQSILLDTIKLAEKGNGYILRFFEALGSRDILEIESGAELLQEQDLMENTKYPLDKSMVFDPYKVKSYLAKL